MTSEREGPPSAGNLLSGEQIERRSFGIIDELLARMDQTRPEWPVIRRIIHATGDPAVVDFIRVHPRAVSAGIEALRAGRSIIADVNMVAAGISRRLADRFGCTIVSAIGDPGVACLARELEVTRSTAAITRLSTLLPGAVVAIGNAPTALFALLDYLAAGNLPPALVVGTPVGFVGAAESKAALVQYAREDLPYITLEGTRGGSAVAVAAVNAILRLAAEE